MSPKPDWCRSDDWSKMLQAMSSYYNFTFFTKKLSWQKSHIPVTLKTRSSLLKYNQVFNLSQLYTLTGMNPLIGHQEMGCRESFLVRF